MKPIALCLFLGILMTIQAGDFGKSTAASELLRQYLALPHPAEDRMGQSRSARLVILDQLSRAPDVLPAIRDILPAIGTRPRAELAEMIGRHLQTKEAASVLAELVKDSDAEVRAAAVHGLRLMSMRSSRSGARRTQHGPDHAAKVEGLVPVLISAARDPDERVRINALFALADARDPQATQELRARLSDSSSAVRFHAACFLTEFNDVSGLAQLTEALHGLQTPGAARAFSHYSDAEMLLASLERITGKSFGEIPLNPRLSSMSNTEVLEKRYQQLLKIWAAWWDWTPESKP